MKIQPPNFSQKHSIIYLIDKNIPVIHETVRDIWFIPNIEKTGKFYTMNGTVVAKNIISSLVEV